MRKYLIHVPSLYQKNKPAAVILNFHGGGSNAQRQRQLSKMDEKSDSEGFIVVYPDGTGKVSKYRTFNVGPGYGYAWKNKINDIYFVEVLLDDLARLFHIDAQRIYSTGYSNGAMMSYRLASELPDRIAAIAPVGASVSTDWLSFKTPTSIIHFHGLGDEQYPFAGGMGKRLHSDKPLYEFPPVMDTLNWYIRNNNCPAQPVETYRKGKAVYQIYGPGDKGAEVILWTMEEAGHTWPSGNQLQKKAGKVSFDISANDLMWEFFKKHPLEISTKKP